MKQSSEMLYKFICNYCKPNILINFCLENYENADSNAFLINDIAFGIQLVKDEFYDAKENLDLSKDFSAFLDAAQNNTLDIFCKYLVDSLPEEHQKVLSDKVSEIFDEDNKKACNAKSFYDIMRVFRDIEESINRP